MNWTFYLDALEIDEPQGFADLVIRAKRDEVWHGVFFEATTSELTFHGDAADYLRDKKEAEGFGAEVEFRAITDCGGTDEVLAGKLDFRLYKQTCGRGCSVTMPVEQEGCIMTLRNRYDQKVDLSNRTAFDGQTVLPDYAGLNFVMELAAQQTKEGVEGYVDDPGQTINYSDSFFGEQWFGFRPTYTRVVLASIETTNLDAPSSEVGADPGTLATQAAITPILLFEDIVTCFDGNFDYDFTLKGTYELTTDHTLQAVRIRLVKGVWPDTVTVIDSQVLPTTYSGSFDVSFTGTTTLAEGDGVYMLLEFQLQSFIGFTADFEIIFSEGTKAIITANKSCPPTTAEVSFVHETASRITEAITDHCLTVKSDYYGRVDSEPYEAAEDGCGGLRVLTSGLRLRKAENPKHFLSLKETFDSLNAIDNIGMTVEGTQLRIEPVEYFYQDVPILNMPFIPDGEYNLEEGMAYSLVKVGYKKWETESVNGLDEFNSNKEFRSTLKSIDNTLDITSNFIAGGYPIEQTRRQSFAATGAADTKYDNDTFIIVVARDVSAYGGIEVEQGNIDGAENIYSPATAYNWRIRPMYNLMRWWKSIAQSYVNLVNTSSKFLFSAGTGNLLATGTLAGYDPCRVDAVRKAENGDLARADVYAGAEPIWKPETINFRYPMSLKDYNLVKANPYGYIYLQCGQGEYEKGYITNLLYRLAKGEAEITLKLKWVQ